MFITKFEANLIKYNQDVHALRLIAAREGMTQALRILDKYKRWLKFGHKATTQA